jgi:hypothetical protein
MLGAPGLDFQTGESTNRGRKVLYQGASSLAPKIEQQNPGFGPGAAKPA